MNVQTPAPHLSVVIPAYNEAGRIEATLRRVLAYLDGRPWASEVLVVLDGSRDPSAEIVRRVAGERREILVLDNGVNRGKGFSVRRGMLEARGRYILFSDADLSTPIEEVERLVGSLEQGYEVAIASRALPDSNVALRQPWWRESMGRTFNWFVRRLALPDIHDSQCGFKCARGGSPRLPAPAPRALLLRCRGAVDRAQARLPHRRGAGHLGQPSGEPGAPDPRRDVDARRFGPDPD